MRIGERVKQLRLAAGMTQADLARAANVSQGRIAHVEAVGGGLNSRSLTRFAAALGVPAAVLLDDNEVVVDRKSLLLTGCIEVLKQLPEESLRVTLPMLKMLATASAREKA